MRRKPTYRLRLEELDSRALLSTFYVAPTGADSAAGSASAPWASLQHAADSVHAGDTVIVQPGAYAGFNLTTSGAASAPIAFRAQPGARITSANSVTGRDGINLEGASYVVIDGFTISGMPRAGIRAVTDNHVAIRNNNCDANGYWGIFTGFSDYADIENNVTSRSQIEHGIYVSNSAVSPTIRNNVSWGNSRNGIHLNGDASEGGSGVITGALVEGNVIHDNGATGGSGINCDGIQNSRIQNNVLYNNHASGISLYCINAAAGSMNNVVANNTVVMAADARWALNIQDGSTGNTVFNNILYDYHAGHGSIDISADSLPGFVCDYNVVMNGFTTDGGSSVLGLSAWQAATGQDLHSLVATPDQLFVNAAGNDYHLSATSPAIGRGTASLAAKSAPAVDVEGYARTGATDVGACEHVTPGTPPNQPVSTPPSQPVTTPAPIPMPAPVWTGAGSGPIFVTGADAGGGPDVKVFDAATGALKGSFFAYDANFTGGVRVAVGDANGDGVPDVITAPGPGGGPDIHVYSGADGALIGRFFAYDPRFSGGCYVASGDVNGDGRADIIVGADAGGGPNVIVFSGRDGSVLSSFFAYDPRFTGGVRVAAGDVNGDGRAEVIAGAGPGGGPNVTVFNGAGDRLGSFFAFDPRFNGGLYVAAGDVNRDGKADIIAGAGSSPNVAAFSGATGAQLENYFAYDPAFTGGTRVAAVDRNGDGKADIVSVAGPGGGPDVRTVDGTSLAQVDQFFAYSPLFRGGLYVAAG